VRLHGQWHALVTLAATAMTVTGCARTPPVTGLAPEAASSTEPVVLEVENHNWSDINIYVVHDGRRNRLTTVTATKDVALQIPPAYQGETGIFRLVVHRIGGRDSYTSEPISIRTGYTVRLTVESDLARSSVGVW